jgi:phosphoribosylanthranilate isomerase
MTGFIFTPASPRCISPQTAAGLPKGGAARVGVFAGQGAEEVLHIMDQAKLDYAQLHGNEDETFCRAIGRERVIKVLWPEKLGGRDDLLAQCQRFAPVCSFFLLDAGKQGGGSGASLPWENLRAFSPPRPWLLAGGLSPENLPQAMLFCSPHAFDCNSGIEEAPGLKSASRLAALARIFKPCILI